MSLNSGVNADRLLRKLFPTGEPPPPPGSNDTPGVAGIASAAMPGSDDLGQYGTTSPAPRFRLKPGADKRERVEGSQIKRVLLVGKCFNECFAGFEHEAVMRHEPKLPWCFTEHGVVSAFEDAEGSGYLSDCAWGRAFRRFEDVHDELHMTNF